MKFVAEATFAEYLLLAVLVSVQVELGVARLALETSLVPLLLTFKFKDFVTLRFKHKCTINV